MARQHRQPSLSRRSSARWWRRLWRVRVVRLLLLGCALYFFSRHVAGPLGRELHPPSWTPQAGQGPRIVTWNLRNFNGLDFRAATLRGHVGQGSHRDQTHDLERLREHLHDLAADVFVFQEIRNPAALAELLPDYDLWTSKQGGHGGQHLGLAVRNDRVQWFDAPSEHLEFTLRGRVRPAISARLPLPDGGVLRVIGVHLKAKPDGLDERRQQWIVLRELIQAQDRQHPGERDLLVMGDFNATGGEVAGQTSKQHPKQPILSREHEVAALTAELAPLGLRSLPLRGGCSAYWDGERRDAWREATQLDFVWVRGLATWLAADTEVLPMGPCARHGCQPARSTKAAPDPDLEWISDHCPLVIDFDRVSPALPVDQPSSKKTGVHAPL